MKKKTDKLIDQKRSEYIERIKQLSRYRNDASLYFKLIKRFSDAEKPPAWSLRDLYPDLNDSQIGEVAAEFFNSISSEYQPIDRSLQNYENLPSWTLLPHEVSQMLKSIKKPRSRVDGDIYPDLVTKYCDILAIPLTHIFNAVLRVGEWPRCWRTETVVIIPKKASPDNLGQCRNLSFTPLFSKTLEKFVFEKLASQAKLSTRQYGGIRKCTLSEPRTVTGGSPQGSILGNLLFTLTTDFLTDGIGYGGPSPNDATCQSSANSSGSERDELVFPLDLSLARIVGDQPSELRVDNITVESEHDDSSLFSRTSFSQSTPTNRGQFAKFVPPGNLVNACLSGNYSSTTGMTFVYMDGIRNAAIGDILSELLSAVTTSRSASNYEFNPPLTNNFSGLAAQTYIDDTNGFECLRLKDGKMHYRDGKPSVSIHARRGEIFFNEDRERSSKIGMKINASKTQLLCFYGGNDVNVRSYIDLGHRPLLLS